MQSFALIVLFNFIGAAFGHPLINRQTGKLPAALFNFVPDNVTAVDPSSYGLYGCTNPQWSGGCAFFPVQNGCQNVRIQNKQGGWVNELHAVGPNHDTKCYAFANADCKNAFYPIRKQPLGKDWGFKFPGEEETTGAVLSFKCEADV